MKRILGVAIAAALVASPMSGHAAGPVTGVMFVSMDEQASCSVSNATLNFGTVAPGAQATGSTTINISCDVGATPALWLSGGNGPYSARTGGLLKSGSGAIVYTLSVAGTGIAVPDNRDGAVSLHLSETGQVSYTVNGKIAAAATSHTTPAGSYADVLMINVAY